MGSGALLTLCTPDLELTSKGLATPPQPMLCTFHTVSHYFKAHAQTCLKTQASGSQEQWMGDARTNRHLHYTFSHLNCNDDGHQWIFLNIPAHTPHLHQTYLVQCLTLNNVNTFYSDLVIDCLEIQQTGQANYYKPKNMELFLRGEKKRIRHLSACSNRSVMHLYRTLICTSL